jgi:hypothetical protein
LKTEDRPINKNLENAMERFNDYTEKRRYPRLFMDLPLEYKVMDVIYCFRGRVDSQL